jgi:hypothetical protein
MLVIFYVSILLSVSFIIIFQASHEAIKPLLKYPQANCTEIYSLFGKTLTQNAFKEWDQNFDDDFTEKETTQYQGILPCFCDEELLSKVPKNKAYSFKIKDEAITFPVCQKYQSDKFNGKILGMMMSFIIVSINWILRNIMITLIKSIGQDTYSQQLKSITNGVFVVQFFNTAILIILVQANFKELGVPDTINKVFNGPFYDFVPLWYVAVGAKLTQTMIIMAMFPFVEWGMAYYRQWLFRKLDNGWTNDTYKTKKTSM